MLRELGLSADHAYSMQADSVCKWRDKDTTTGAAIPLLPSDKRRILSNFTERLVYSKPAANHFGSKKVCMRQRVACGTCALVDWIDNAFPCFLFADCPDEVKPKVDKREDECESDEDENSEHEGSEQEEGATHQRRGKVLRDAKGYYVIDAHAINELLDVGKYIEAWPLIPIEELHASSVQHPSFPQYRWLLNTRRVRTHTADEATAADASRPPCAGVGTKEEPVWICKSCMQCLCRPEPIMPRFALANWNWGGRLHPQYKDLNVITKSLLGLATMVCRLIVLQHSEHAEDQEKGSEWFLIKSFHF